jgi:hypothetical protein
MAGVLLRTPRRGCFDRVLNGNQLTGMIPALLGSLSNLQNMCVPMRAQAAVRATHVRAGGGVCPDRQKRRRCPMGATLACFADMTCVIVLGTPRRGCLHAGPSNITNSQARFRTRSDRCQPSSTCAFPPCASCVRLPCASAGRRGTAATTHVCAALATLKCGCVLRTARRVACAGTSNPICCVGTCRIPWQLFARAGVASVLRGFPHARRSFAAPRTTLRRARRSARSTQPRAARAGPAPLAGGTRLRARARALIAPSPALYATAPAT